MPIKPAALAASLKRSLPPIVWVHGNESLIVIECCDAVREAARSQGYEERIVLTAERGFKAAELLAQVNTMSLFATRKLIELRFSGRPAKDIATAVADLADAGMPDDVRLLVSSERPDPGLLRSATMRSIDAAGLIVEVFPIDHNSLTSWIADRLGAQQQQAEPALLRTIAERVEGNLLAAKQEILKLGLLFDQGMLPTEQAMSAVMEVARYDAQDLTDAILQSDFERTIRTLHGLAGAGHAETLVIWHLAECARAMLRLQAAIASGAPLRPVLAQARAFGPRQRLYEQAARRISGRTAAQALTDIARADTMAKGYQRGDTWAEIQQIALSLAGSPQPRAPA